MRPPRLHSVGVARAQSHLLLWIAQEEPQRALDHIEGVLDMAVVVPGHHLLRGYLELRDAKARTRRMHGLALDVEEGTRMLAAFHRVLRLATSFYATMGIGDQLNIEL